MRSGVVPEHQTRKKVQSRHEREYNEADAALNKNGNLVFRKKSQGRSWVMVQSKGIGL